MPSQHIANLWYNWRKANDSLHFFLKQIFVLLIDSDTFEPETSDISILSDLEKLHRDYFHQN